MSTINKFGRVIFVLCLICSTFLYAPFVNAQTSSQALVKTQLESVSRGSGRDTLKPKDTSTQGVVCCTNWDSSDGLSGCASFEGNGPSACGDLFWEGPAE